MYKKYYQKFLSANVGKQHYAAHSHHYWPDVTFDATVQYWNDSAKFVDDKWNYFFTEKIPRAQKLIANILKLSEPSQIVFAPNTHEFVHRLLSCFPAGKTVRILTTDSEFYSFERQVNRLTENGSVQVTRIATEPFADFSQRFQKAIQAADYDMIFFSQVFFNSGYAIKSMNEIVDAVKTPETIIAIDGYHSFMALPTDLSLLDKRVFYMAGSYKYAQGGEGCCFMSVPIGCKLRPSYTGWFASFADLATTRGQVAYSEDGMRFAGSTMDFSALYRLLAVLELFEKENLTVEIIHTYIKKLQTNFRLQLESSPEPLLSDANILHHDWQHHGHFYAFELKDVAVAKRICDDLATKNIKTDYRQSRLRFGFGLYQDELINFKEWKL